MGVQAVDIQLKIPAFTEHHWTVWKTEKCVWLHFSKKIIASFTYNTFYYFTNLLVILDMIYIYFLVLVALPVKIRML